MVGHSVFNIISEKRANKFIKRRSSIIYLISPDFTSPHSTCRHHAPRHLTTPPPTHSHPISHPPHPPHYAPLLNPPHTTPATHALSHTRTRSGFKKLFLKGARRHICDSPHVTCHVTSCGSPNVKKYQNMVPDNSCMGPGSTHKMSKCVEQIHPDFVQQ